MSVALVTGGSAGLGRALVGALAARGWTVITDARHSEALDQVRDPGVITIAGDIGDADHRDALVAEVGRQGRLDLLVHNASDLGPTPLPALAEIGAEEMTAIWRPNVIAPLLLTANLLPTLKASAGILVSISSDAAVEHYPGWGAYGASKAALDHITLQFGAEGSAISAYAIDPGDMRTAMHQAAFPGEDISDRPLPETVVPQLLALLERRPPNGRYRAADFDADSGAGSPTDGAAQQRSEESAAVSR
ncbi:SDR family oxidoreductase [Microlunatus sp. Gsoil 973]|uniref:SDR family NAD(P)-dependent oxidoreductase n=1 Tax=Microlunatus sp. Gsoil 973 TaxID=2672569 RepID=UPI0012B44233|nr:SDR family oxidoreductase [Microlunatus sp. Gsoil 973]QGN34817.1 SDR family NAD(P)-dependent oxidoreductase [Microlunatus sp. Gsoil 973]